MASALLSRRIFVAGAGASLVAVVRPAWTDVGVTRATICVDGFWGRVAWHRDGGRRSIELGPCAAEPGKTAVPDGVIRITLPSTGTRDFGYEQLTCDPPRDTVRNNFGEAVFEELLQEINRRRG